MSNGLTSWQRSERRMGWLLLVCSTPLAIGGVIMLVQTRPFSDDWWVGLACTLMFGASGAMGVSKLRRAPERGTDIDLAQTRRVSMTRGRLVMLTLLGVAMTAGSGTIAATIPWDGLRAIVGGPVCAVLCFAGTCALAWQAVKGGGPIYDIGPDGIRLWRQGDVLVPWRRMRAIREFIVHGQRFICIEVEDWNELVARAPRPVSRAQSWGNSVNAQLGFGDIALTTSSMDVSGSDIRALVQTHARSYGIVCSMEPG